MGDHIVILETYCHRQKVFEATIGRIKIIIYKDTYVLRIKNRSEALPSFP